MGFRYGALFDMDGVLVDNARFHVLTFEEWCKGRGVPFDREHFEKHLFGKQNKDIFRVLLGVEFTPDELDREDRYKEALYRDLYAAHVRPLEGLIAFMEDLKSHGFGLAVATSGPPENVDLVLRKTGAVGLFDAVVTSVDVTRGKPDPQVFLLAAERLGLSPTQCVVFEDSVAGAQAAISSGATLIGVTTGRPHLDGSATMIDDFTQITVPEAMALVERGARVGQ